jgi:hypothetical protein
MGLMCNIKKKRLSKNTVRTTLMEFDLLDL